MENLLASGSTVQVTATAAAAVGTGYVVGQLFGVTENSAAASGDLLTVRVTGIVTLPKVSALAIDPGDAVYWDDRAGFKQVNKTSSGNKEIGIAVSTAANPSSTVEVLLVPTVRTSVAA